LPWLHLGRQSIFCFVEKILTQFEFDAAAIAWASFIQNASPGEVQALFQAGNGASFLYQTSVSFDLTGTATAPSYLAALLSTPGIAQVNIRFVLLPLAEPSADAPAPPRFRLVLYAADERGGRLSAYYQSDAAWQEIAPLADSGGLVPYNLIKGWLNAWAEGAVAQQLRPALFATTYGPLQGYNFELRDFLDPLFAVKSFTDQRLFIRFGLKTYYPAYPEALAAPAQTFGLVVRLYSPSSGADGAELSGPSYDLSVQVPPG
jgi:hypothetical protein